MKEFLGGCPEGINNQIIALALRKCNMNIEDAIGMLIEDEKVADLKDELAA